jgi:glycine cleavage system H protein
VSDYDFPKELRYSTEDEWARQEGEIVTIGITDYAQQQLGDVVFVELPEPGTAVSQGETFGVIESVKAVSDLYAPVSGEVLEINRNLADKPELVNESCYGGGFLLSVRLTDEGELDALLDAGGYAANVEERGG